MRFEQIKTKKKFRSKKQASAGVSLACLAYCLLINGYCFTTAIEVPFPIQLEIP